MPITMTQEVYEIRSLSPVHINPSIMEGTQQLTSVLGPDRGLTIVRYAPSFIVSVIVTGDAGIPSWLECSAGVVDASPQAFRDYQWYADGVPIPGANSNRFLTDNSYDGKLLKCVVRAFNILGEAFSESNEILATVIEPIFLREADYYPITGLGAEDTQTILNMSFFPLTGMSVDDHVTNFGIAAYPITGMGSFEAETVYLLDIYTANFYTLMRTLPLTDNGAESGSISGWTLVAGDFVSTSTTAYAGSRVFESNNTTVASRVERVVSISDSGDLAEIAAGNAAVKVSFWATNNTTNDVYRNDMRIYLEALDSGGAVVGTLDQLGWVNPFPKTASNFWQNFSYAPEALPVTTTQIRIIIEFEAENNAGGNSCQLDEISLQLFKV